MSLNLGSILRASALESPEQTAIIFGTETISYARFDELACRIAAELRSRGIAPGDKVALLLPNVPAFSLAYFGILYAGATVVPLNVLAVAPEVRCFLEDSAAKLLIAHELFAGSAKPGAEQAGVPLLWVGPDKPPLGRAEIDPLDGAHETAAKDTAVILYTSGTTGQSKGAELSHQNLFLNCAFVMPRLMKGTGLTEHVALATLPLFHSFGQTCIQNAAIAAGGSFSILSRFDPAEALAILERDKVSIFAGVPTMYFALLHHQAEREYELSHLRVCITGGAPMPVEVMNAFEEKFPGVQIQEGYGLSETSPVASFGVRGRTRKVGSIGYPVWGVEMCIQDERDQLLGDDERGEICIRGHNIMKGYHARPEATADAIREGWFHSGDVGFRDRDGCYWIVDRKKDMILRGGFNVYPREIEEVLYTHPAIAEATVIGVPHESHGEEVKAFVALAKDQKLSAEDLIAFCKERLAAYKYPRHIEFLAELPKGPTGKILKRKLR